jgi:hypothetical protein
MLAATEQFQETRPIAQRPRRVTPAPHPVAVHTPLSIVQAALQSGNVEMYREAVALAKEMDAITSRKAFDNAMADAKAKIPVIRKNRRVGFDSRKAGSARTEYMHEDMAEIARTIDPILSERGLSYRFRVASEPNLPVKVTCIISHREGHSEETSLHAARDESGNKNGIQAIGSTVTYLQRYTLKAALGLAASDDDDGRSSEQATAPAIVDDNPDCITQRQADDLRSMLNSYGIAPRAFLQFIRLPRIEDIGAQHFDRCVAKIKEVGRKS